MKRILYFIKRVASSRIGHTLLIVHLSLVVFDFAQKQPVSRAESNIVRTAENQSSSSLLAGRGFHWHYESTLLKFLVLADLPGIFLSLLIALILVPLFYVLPTLGEYDASWVGAVLLLLATSIQWQFIGYCLERVIRAKKNA